MKIVMTTLAIALCGEIVAASAHWNGITVNNWNISNVKFMDNMFNGARVFNQPLDKWDTSNVKDMRYMFQNASSFNETLDSWNTSNVTSMTQMFSGCYNLTSLDLSSFNTSNVFIMNYMFYRCRSLTTILVGDGWNTDKVSISDSNLMFDDCVSLVGGDGTKYDPQYKCHKSKKHIKCSGGNSLI